MYSVQRRYYSRLWMNFTRQFGFDRANCEFDKYGNCIGLKLNVPYNTVKETLRSLRMEATQGDPESAIFLYGIVQMRIINFDTYCTISEET